MPDSLNHIFSEPANLATAWSAFFANELYRCGLRHAVISPGSRSTPLTLAMAAHPHIQTHVVLDERLAGFMALGIGKASGRPAALICTSGTAVANYYPAVVEARMSGVPLLVLSADRPPALRQVGANQAIRQQGIFGSYTVFEHDAGEPVARTEDFRRLEILAGQAWNSSIHHGGPAQVNFPFRKPLEPTAAFRDYLPGHYTETLEARTEPLTRSAPVQWRPPAAVFQTIARSRRPVIIAGTLPAHGLLPEILDMLSDEGIPLLCEAGASSGRQTGEAYITGFNAFLRSASVRDRLQPDLIIQIGPGPSGKGLEHYLREYRDIPRLHFQSNALWAEPSLGSSITVQVPANAELVRVPLTKYIPEGWLRDWQETSREYLAQRDTGLQAASVLRDGDVHAVVAASLTAPETVMISNSFPARDADLFAMPAFGRHTVFMNRGASGIDGITSTAAGLSLAGSQPVTLLTGDLAFLHDLTALLAAPALQQVSLRILVINNQGGQIFRMLPVYEPSDWYTRLFETPQHVDFAALGKGFGVQTSEVTTASQLQVALEQPRKNGIEIIICHTHPDESMHQRRDLWNAWN